MNCVYAHKNALKRSDKLICQLNVLFKFQHIHGTNVTSDSMLFSTL